MAGNNIGRFRALTLRIGALPAKRVTWSLVLLFSIWVLVDVFVLRLSSGLSLPTYDAMVRARFHTPAPDSRVVIVDIDEASLARLSPEFGRWPWPRDTLATVLTHIERQKPAAVVWDILFSDQDRLNPGGDAAFDAAARASVHSHYSVVRLPAANDAVSQITQPTLPGLWLPGTAEGAKSTVALIAPALAGVAAQHLGYNNGYVDPDGVLRRYRYAERLADGSVIQSLPLSVLRSLDAGAAHTMVQNLLDRPNARDELIVWPAAAKAHARLSFADVFTAAEGGRLTHPLPDFAGKVVIIGSTAPSLHDVRATPLSPTQAGVEALAVAIDNALNQHHMLELPRTLQAALAIALCVALALWVQFKSVASLAPALFVLPAGLLGLSYLSLNGFPIFLDLNLSAGLALLFLTLLRYWSSLRRDHWCSPPPASEQPILLWPCTRNRAWLDAPLDRLIDAVQKHAPQCRVVVIDASASWPAKLRWPELARFAAVVGPQDALLEARSRLEPALRRLAVSSSEPVAVGIRPNRKNLASAIFTAWAALQKSDTKQHLKEKDHET